MGLVVAGATVEGTLVSHDTNPLSDALGAVALGWFGFHVLNRAPRRVLALLADVLVLTPPMILLDRAFPIPLILGGPLPLLIPYRVLSHWLFGRTVGKWAFGLEVTHRSNDVLPFEDSLTLISYGFRPWLPRFGSHRSESLSDEPWRRSFGVCFKRELPLILVTAWPLLLEPIPVGQTFGLILITGLMGQIGWIVLDAGAMADSHGTSSLHDLFAGTAVMTRTELAQAHSELRAAAP